MALAGKGLANRSFLIALPQGELSAGVAFWSLSALGRRRVLRWAHTVRGDVSAHVCCLLCEHQPQAAGAETAIASLS